MKFENIAEQVYEFHKKFEPVTHVTDPEDPYCQRLTPEQIRFRKEFQLEEFVELMNAFRNGDDEEIVDALIDTIWVALGTLLMHYGVDVYNEAAKAVFEANMAKELPEEGGLKIRKPQGWLSPDMYSIIERFYNRMEESHAN